jgi:hypothetical protein
MGSCVSPVTRTQSQQRLHTQKKKRAEWVLSVFFSMRRSRQKKELPSCVEDGAANEGGGGCAALQRIDKRTIKQLSSENNNKSSTTSMFDSSFRSATLSSLCERHGEIGKMRNRRGSSVVMRSTWAEREQTSEKFCRQHTPVAKKGRGASPASQKEHAFRKTHIERDHHHPTNSPKDLQIKTKSMITVISTAFA